MSSADTGRAGGRRAEDAKQAQDKIVCGRNRLRSVLCGLRVGDCDEGRTLEATLLPALQFKGYLLLRPIAPEPCENMSEPREALPNLGRPPFQLEEAVDASDGGKARTGSSPTHFKVKKRDLEENNRISLTPGLK